MQYNLKSGGGGMVGEAAQSRSIPAESIKKEFCLPKAST
jgi:hypothetical protein